MTIKQIVEKIIKKEVSAKELIQDFVRKIEEDNLNVFITKMTDHALQKAENVDKKIATNQKVGVLAGVPIGIKDVFCTNGIRTTCASNMLENFVPTYESTVTNRILSEDGIIVGKTNQDEFCMGSTGKNSFFGPTINNHKNSKMPNVDLFPGGSSSGSAVAVSGDFCIASMGTDTGGSVRQPAALCGIYGLRPSYGRISRRGIISFSNSFDQAGIFAKNVEDIATMLDVISGPDAGDMTTYSKKESDFLDINYLAREKKIGILKDTFNTGVNESIRNRIKKVIENMTGQGVVFEEIELPISMQYGLDVYYIITCAEAATNLSKFDGLRYGASSADLESRIQDFFVKNRTGFFKEELMRRIMLGSLASSSVHYEEGYLKASKIRNLICQEFDNVFQKYDFILSPTSPILAMPIDQEPDPYQVWLSDIFTIPSNMTGACSINVPIGNDSETSLPIGLQLIGKMFREKDLLSLSYFVENNCL